MFKSGFALNTDEKLFAAQFNKSNVSVWRDGKIKHYGGPIEELTDAAVIIAGGVYLKTHYEFRIK